MKQLRLRNVYSRQVVLAIACCGCALNAGASEVANKDRVVMRDGVKHVVNPGVGSEPARVLKTTELWRRGGSDDDIVFGTIGAVTRDRRGNTYLLDVQLCEIRVMSPDGRHIATLGRQGEGPAEFQYASGVAILSDSVVCVTQVMPARIVRMTVGGRAMGDHPLSSNLIAGYINGCDDVGGRLAVKTGQMVHGDTSVGLRTTFVTLDAEGKVVTTYWERFQKADFANIQFDEKADAEPVWAFGADGRLYVNDDWDRYEIAVIGTDGKLQHVVECAYEHRRRPSRELEAIENQKRAGEVHPDTKVSATSRDIVRLFPRDDGTLWVLSSRGELDAPAGAVATFDQFDQDGASVCSVTVQGPRRQAHDDFYLIDNLVFVVTGGDDEGAGEGDVEVVCLRLESAR